MLLVAVLCNLGVLAAPLWMYQFGNGREVVNGLAVTAEQSDAGPQEISFTENPFHLAFFSLVVIASAWLFLSIFQYHNRKRQMKWGYVGLVALLLEVLSLVLFTNNGPFLLGGSSGGIEVQWGFALPVLALVLVWWAIRRIKADEELVRSVDRIR